jgi:hypothetical protein
MLVLTDSTINNAVDNISGYIATETAKKLDITIEEATRLFFESHTYVLLSDKETGYYWDSISELITMFISEIHMRQELQ